MTDEELAAKILQLKAILRAYRKQHDAIWDNHDAYRERPSPCRCEHCRAAMEILGDERRDDA